MGNKDLEAMALFRFSLIAPVVNGTYEASSQMAYFRMIAGKEHKLPNGDKTIYAPDTIKKWANNYKRQGIDGLMPKRRNDKGRSRVLKHDAIEKIHEIKEQYPYITGKMVYRKLVEEGYIKASEVSTASVHRYIREHQLKRRELAPVERRAYEMTYANDCWQSDTSFGPKIIIDGRKVRTYLIAIIDDASRLMVHSEFFFNDNAVNMQSVLKKAVAKYGVPKRLFVDNGKSYKNGQLNLICASLGVALIHARAYSPESKGKIERSFRTFKDGYINATDWNSFESLEDLNSGFSQYLDRQYQNSIHSIIKTTPKERYFKDIDKIKYKSEKALEDCFLHRVTRKVNHDATIKVNGKYFEVPQKYIGQKINIRYNPIELNEAYIFNEQQALVIVVYPLKRIDNSKVKRNVIDYTKIVKMKGETHV